MNYFIKSGWQKKFGRFGLLNSGEWESLDGFSLANDWWLFAKFTKLSHRQTFLLYGIKLNACIRLPIANPICKAVWEPEIVQT